jgi:thioredoxin-related protein
VTTRLSQLLWLILALLCGSAFAQDPIRWAPDLATARQTAAQYKVPLLIHFYGDNCLPCKTLEHRVLSQQEVVGSLNRFFICVKINATSDAASKKAAQDFGVHSWPTDVFVSPDGKTLFQGVCPQDPRAYVAILENVKVMNRDRNIMLAARVPQQPANTVTQQVNNVGKDAYTAGLPAPGNNLASTSTSPTFYTADASARGAQQLPNSAGPNMAVQNGPLLPGGQPGPITGSTPAAHQQLAPNGLAQHPTPPTTPAMAGQLPIQQPPVAQLPSGQSALQNSFSTVQNQPPASANRAATSHGSSSLLSANTSTHSQVVPNPHFNQPQPNLGAAQGAGASASVANAAAMGFQAQNVSFYPRSSQASESLGQNLNMDAQQVTSIAAPAGAPLEEPPAIDGYCPVALKSSRGWVAGDPRLAVRHRGRVYWLSDQAAMAEFLRTPDSCSPKFSGYDPMLFLKEGRLVEGSVQYGLLEELSGTFMFFSSAELKREYEQQFEKNTRAINFIVQQAYSAN